MWLDPLRYTAPMQGINYGHYRVAMRSGLLAPTFAANSPCWAMRWNPAAQNPVTGTNAQCVLTGLYAVAQTITAFSSAQEFSISAYIIRTMNTSYSGGSAPTLTADNNQMRSSMGASLMADMRIAGTQPLGGGGGTNAIDSQPFASSGSYTSTATVPLTINFSVNMAAGEHPIVLNADEGILIQNDIALGAGGTVRLGVVAVWAELPGY